MKLNIWRDLYQFINNHLLQIYNTLTKNKMLDIY